MTQKKLKIVICGHYGATNIGDEAIGLSLVSMFKRIKPESEITILSYDKKKEKEFYRKYAPELKIKTAYLFPLGLRSFLRGLFKGEIWRTLKEIKQCDIFVLGGGGLFTDERLYAVFLWGIHAFLANIYKKRLFMIGQSVGPLETKTGKWLTKKAFSKAEFISVRDKMSEKLLKRIGIETDIDVSTDAAIGLTLQNKKSSFSIIENLNKKIEQSGCRGYFIYSMRSWKGISEKSYKIIVQAVHELSLKYKLLPVLIPFQVTKEDDAAFTSKILEQKYNKFDLYKQNFTDDITQLLQIFEQSEFVIGFRLHSLIFSFISNTPCIAFSYSPKVKRFMKQIGMDNFIFGFNNLDKEKIIISVINIFENEDKIKTKLKNTNKYLLERWKKTERKLLSKI